MRLTPRLSRRMANSVCGSWQSWTRSCAARIASAFAQELARDVLSRSHSDSECVASSGNCGDFGHVLHVADPPLKRRCIQVVHVVDGFCFLGVPLRSDFGVGNVDVLQKKYHQDRVTHDVAVIHVPQVSQASVFLQRMRRHW